MVWIDERIRKVYCMENCLWILMCILLLVATVEDIKEKKVHIVLLIFLLVVGGIGGISAFFEQSQNLWQLLGGLIIGVCMIGFSLLSQGNIGMADGIIIMALGIFSGARDCLVIVSIASLAMAFISIVILCLRRGNRYTRMPFVPALLMGFCLMGWIS